ncbi:MAG: hypothetical protein K6E85_16425 [Lachnospiraceae bacterium]|nr:hypothetical protein [Lachnospiraceae bacterium]
MSDDTYREIAQKQGAEVAKAIKMSDPENMYICCLGKIEQLMDSFNGKVLYRTFEEAYPYYQQNGHLEENGNLEIKEFNNLMEFLFLGRKSKTDKIEDPLLVINMI